MSLGSRRDRLGARGGAGGAEGRQAMPRRRFAARGHGNRVAAAGRSLEPPV